MWSTGTSLVAGLAALTVVAMMFDIGAPRARIPARQGPSSPTSVAPRRWAIALLRATATVRHRRLEHGAVPPGVVAEWCDAMARRLRTGESLRQVLASEHPEHPALGAQTEPLRRALRHGDSVADSIAATASAPASPASALGLVWSVLTVTADYGGSTAAPLDRAAAALRLRSADAHERAAQSAQARLSAHVLTAIPLVVLVFLVVTDHDVRMLLGEPSGWLPVGAGAALNLCGWWWMRRIVAHQSS